MMTPKNLPDRPANASSQSLDLPEQIYIAARDPLAKARAIQQCLQYRCYEAEVAQLPLAAHLIGAAAEYLADVVERGPKPSN